MEQFKFSRQGIDQLFEKVGVDVRPVIEVKAEVVKLQEYARRLTERWPQLYENVMHGPSHFQISKTFIFPGKGELEIETFTVTSRGPVFTFPRKLGMLGGEEPALPDVLNNIVLRAMDIYAEQWPTHMQLRYGKVQEAVFDTGTHDALELIANRFLKVAVPKGGEVRLRVNLATEEFNRIVEIQPLAKHTVSPYGRLEASRTSIGVIADFNNRDMSKPLGKSDRNNVLTEADRFFSEDLYQFLNERE